MNEFMKILLSLSVSGTLLLLLILGLKLLYKNKFSRRWQYYIWIVVILRFLLPFTPNTINVGSLFQMFYTTITTNKSPASPNVPVTPDTYPFHFITKKSSASPKIPVTGNTNDNETKPIQTSVYLFFVWSALALVLFVRKITIYQGFVRYIKAGNTEISEIKTLNLLSDCEEKRNSKTRIELYHNVLVASPIMIGFFRPSIILPVGELEEKELSYIFMHELCHYKQRDMFYKWLIQIVICIHWFNPFVYLLEKEVNRACELSCDEAVLSVLDEKAKREYGDMLISFFKSNNLYKSSLASVTLSEGAKHLKERLGAIMNFKKKTKAIQILTGVLTWCIIFGAAFVGISPVSAAVNSNSVGVSAAADSNFVGTSESPRPDEKNPSMPDEKSHKTGTYIYDENSDSGWYLGDETWDNNWDEKDKAFPNSVRTSESPMPDEKNLKTGTYIYGENSDSGWYLGDEAWDNNWDKEDKAFAETYAAYGIEKNGKSIYYQSELIYVFLDPYSDNSFYVEINPKGTKSIQMIRNKEGKITGVSYMTEEEVTELVGGRMEIPLINTKEWDSSSLLTIEAYYKTDNIFILPSTTNKVILKEYLTEDKSSYYASTEMKNDVLTIRSGDRPARNYKSCIEIYIPDDLDNVKIETVSGAITVDSCTGALALSTTSGGIYIYDTNIAGNAKIETVSGAIAVDRCTGVLALSTTSGGIYINDSNIAGNAKIETVSGAIAVDSCTGVLALSTTSGRIYINNSNVAGNVNTVSGEIGLSLSDIMGDFYVNSHSGKILAYPPTATSYKLKAKTTTGKIRCGHFKIQPENEREFSEIVGSNPKFTITLKTTFANIDIN